MNQSVILKNLDKSEAVDWDPEFNEAKEIAYDFISTILLTSNLTEDQCVNAIRCLFRLRFHVPEQQAFMDILKHCRSDSLRVRSIAIRLASGMIGLAEASPIPSRQFTVSREDLLLLEEGLGRGVDEATQLQARAILRQRI